MKKRIIIILPILILTIGNISLYQAAPSLDTSLPSSFCWCNITGIDYTTPIRDQSPTPTCEAYALIASLETKMQYQKQEIYQPDLSETHLYFYAGGSYESGYVNLVDAANYLIEYGVPDEGCYPDPHRAYDYPFTSLEGWQQRTVKIQEWGWVKNTEEDIKTALIEYGPLIFCAHFRKDFYSYRNGIYGQKPGSFVGGHVMTIVGYNDNEQCWIVKNSWGSSWGIDGWLKMAYDANIITDSWYKRYDENCTGIIYLQGVYGNLQPEAPKVYIQNMDIKKTYLFGKGVSTILRNLPYFTEATPRIFGDIEIQVATESATYVEFYIDGELVHSDVDPPYTWNLDSDRGRHTLKVIAINEESKSMDIRDFYKIF